MTYRYTVQVFKLGALLAEIHTAAGDALTAIGNAEKMVKAEPKPAGELTEGSGKYPVFWSGLEFVARRGAVA